MSKEAGPAWNPDAAKDVQRFVREESIDQSDFHDPAQSIFGGEVPLDDLRLVRYDLPWNCRNTRGIAEWAATSTGEPPRCRAGAPEGEPPTERTAKSEDEMLDAVRKSLHELVQERGFPPSARCS